MKIYWVNILNGTFKYHKHFSIIELSYFEEPMEVEWEFIETRNIHFSILGFGFTIEWEYK